MTELDVYQPPAAVAVHAPVTAEMDSWIAVCSDVIKVANVICDTPFVPDGLRGSGPAVAAAILAGRELSLGPMTSLANIHVIKGKPALSAVLMRALVLAQGHYWRDVEVTDTRAVIEGRRRTEAEWTRVSFTADQARQAKIDLSAYPQDKLYARATSRLARRKFADVIAGMPYSAEELEDGGEAERTETVVPAAAEPVKPVQRTAQRRQRAAAPKDTPGPSGASQQAGQDRTPASRDGGPGAPQPPLPGEEEDPTRAGSSSAGHSRPPQETSPSSASSPSTSQPDDTDYDTPGTITEPQLKKLHTVLTKLGFGSGERDQKLVTASVIVRRELESSKDLSFSEAKALIDTLERCGTREKLIELLAAAEAASGE